MSSTHQWPLTGTRTAKVGMTIKSSFKKGPKNLKVERDFHAVRYNFRPQGMDAGKPASLDIMPCKDDHGSISKIVLEQPIANKDDVFVFEGVEKPMQHEQDCVLIWDESLQTLTLERVESHINLTHKGQRPPTKRTSSNSPAATPEASGSASSVGSPVKHEIEEEVSHVKVAPPPKRPMPFHPKPKPTSTASPLQLPTSTSSPIPSPVSTKPRPRPAKRTDPTPASPPPAKRARTPPKPFGLQLPTAGSVGLAFPLMTTPAAPLTKPIPVPEPVVAPIQLIDDDEDEEDDMEEVEPEASTYSPAANGYSAEPTTAPTAPARAFSDTFMMEEDEGDKEEVFDGEEVLDEEVFDDEEFAADLEIAMRGEGDDGDEEEDDDDMEAVEPAIPLSGDGPISMNSYAGGGGLIDDEYSDSDESD